jgi:hypothetical protein
VHFTNAVSYVPASNTNSTFLNPAFVEALFPNENIFLSLGDFQLYTPYAAMLPGIAALTRIQILHMQPNPYPDLYINANVVVKTLLNEILLVNKHGIRRAIFRYFPIELFFLEVACPF